MRLAFFVDANLEPDVARFLQQDGYRAEYSDYVLDEDADDEADILAYVREEELIVITADVKNFAAFELIEQYGSPDHMNGKKENLDKWLLP